MCQSTAKAPKTVLQELLFHTTQVYTSVIHNKLQTWNLHLDIPERYILSSHQQNQGNVSEILTHNYVWKHIFIATGL